MVNGLYSDRTNETVSTEDIGIENISQNKSSPASGQTIKTKDVEYNTGNRVYPNPLNQAVTYTSKFTLSALSRNDIEYPERILKSAPHHIVARTGGIVDANTSDSEDFDSIFKANSVTSKAMQSTLKKKFTKGLEVLNRGHDIFFDSVLIESINRPNEQRKLTNFNLIEIVMVEPMGVTLFEKLKAAAFANGFIDHADAPFLLSIDFAGQTESQPIFRQDKTGHYNQLQRKLPIKISNCEMSFRDGKATYTMKCVPWTEFALTDRFAVTRHGSGFSGVIRYLGQALNRNDTLGGAMDKLAEVLTQHQTTEVEKQKRELIDDYKIHVDPSLFDLTRQSDANYNINGSTGNFAMTWSAGTNITNLIAKTVMKADKYRNIADLVEVYLKNLTGSNTNTAPEDVDVKSMFSGGGEFVPWFKIKTNVLIRPEYDNIRKTHRKTIVYQVIPYNVHVLNFVIPGLKIDSGNIGRTIKKEYNYIYTGKNQEILDLDIDYKYSYFQSRLIKAFPGQESKKDFNLREIFTTRIGREILNENLLDIRSEPTIMGSSNPFSNSSTDDAEGDEFFDYLTNPLADMVKVDLKIMGDPAWLGHDSFLPYGKSKRRVIKKKYNEEDFSDHYSESKQYVYEDVISPQGLGWNEQYGMFNFDQAEPLLRLNFVFPTDINEKTGLMDFKNLEKVAFSGIYKVAKVVSEFSNGAFTQNLLCVRLNNQGEKVDQASVIKAVKSGEGTLNVPSNNKQDPNDAFGTELGTSA